MYLEPLVFLVYIIQWRVSDRCGEHPSLLLFILLRYVSDNRVCLSPQNFKEFELTASERGA